MANVGPLLCGGTAGSGSSIKIQSRVSLEKKREKGTEGKKTDGKIALLWQVGRPSEVVDEDGDVDGTMGIQERK